jgi:hypothetical protein
MRDSFARAPDAPDTQLLQFAWLDIHAQHS